MNVTRPKQKLNIQNLYEDNVIFVNMIILNLNVI